MSKTVFTFGQRGGYYFECPSKWQFSKLPSGLHQLFKDKEVAATFCVTLGADDSYVVSYKGKDGFLHVTSSGVPDGLTKWLYAKDSDGDLVRDLESLRVSLGPYNRSFFAFDGKAYLWQNLPEALSDAIQERRNPSGDFAAAPRLVELGVGENYIMITGGQGGSWSLGNYRELDGMIDVLREKEGGLGLLHNIKLNAYRLQNFILQSPNGILMYDGVADHVSADISDIGEAIKSDYEAEARALAQKEEMAQMVVQRNQDLRRQTELLLQLQQQRQVQQQRQLQQQLNNLQTLNAFSAMLGVFGAMNVGGGGFGYS